MLKHFRPKIRYPLKMEYGKLYTTRNFSRKLLSYNFELSFFNEKFVLSENKPFSEHEEISIDTRKVIRSYNISCHYNKVGLNLLNSSVLGEKFVVSRALRVAVVIT